MRQRKIHQTAPLTLLPRPPVAHRQTVVHCFVTNWGGVQFVLSGRPDPLQQKAMPPLLWIAFLWSHIDLSGARSEGFYLSGFWSHYRFTPLGYTLCPSVGIRQSAFQYLLLDCACWKQYICFDCNLIIDWLKKTFLLIFKPENKIKSIFLTKSCQTVGLWSNVHLLWGSSTAKGFNTLLKHLLGKNIPVRNSYPVDFTVHFIWSTQRD